MRPLSLALFSVMVCMTVAAQGRIVSVDKYDLPKYPPILRAARIEGEVDVELTIDGDGPARSLKLGAVRPKDDNQQTRRALKEAFGKVVLDSLRSWTFRCYECDVKDPVKQVVTFRFELDPCYETSVVIYTLELPRKVTITVDEPLIDHMSYEPQTKDRRARCAKRGAEQYHPISR